MLELVVTQHTLPSTIAVRHVANFRDNEGLPWRKPTSFRLIVIRPQYHSLLDPRALSSLTLCSLISCTGWPATCFAIARAAGPDQFPRLIFAMADLCGSRLSPVLIIRQHYDCLGYITAGLHCLLVSRGCPVSLLLKGQYSFFIIYLLRKIKITTNIYTFSQLKIFG